MDNIERTVKISPKGQITLPKQVREILASDLVTIVAKEGSVTIEPVRDVGGSLSRYASRFIPLKEAREKAWPGVVHEKHTRD